MLSSLFAVGLAAGGLLLAAAHGSGTVFSPPVAATSHATADNAVMICVTHRSFCNTKAVLPDGSPCSCVDELEGNIPGRAWSLDEILSRPELLSGGPGSRR